MDINSLPFHIQLSIAFAAVIVFGTIAGLVSIQRGKVKARAYARARAAHPAGKGR